MPKQKTHRGAAKRFSVTKTGKIKRAQMHKQHNPHLMTPKRTRQLRKGALVSAADAKVIRKLIPYK